MSNVLYQHSRVQSGITLSPGWKPVEIFFRSGQKTIINFENGNQALSTCLRCYDTPCMTFDSSEVVPSNFDQFPADKNLDVCSVGAMTKSDLDHAPQIKAELCISCGVCSSRCPVGAISLLPLHGAHVEDVPNEAFIEIGVSDKSVTDANRHLLSSIPSSGLHLFESDEIVDDIFSKLALARVRVGDRLANLLARNLLIGAGNNASLGRKGNVHMRMDLILSPPGVEQGIAEVEFGQDAVLDAPRDLLDSLAVIVSRYGWELKSIKPIIVSDLLPNRRSEYWHVIQDIANVFQLRIKTITIFTLMMYNWNRSKIDLNSADSFYADKDTQSYRSQILEVALGRKLNLSMSPRPQIDIAK